MAEKDKIDLSKLNPEQIRQLEELLANLISSAKPRVSAERMPVDCDHSSHVSG